MLGKAHIKFILKRLIHFLFDLEFVLKLPLSLVLICLNSVCKNVKKYMILEKRIYLNLETNIHIYMLF